jgi:type III secretion protein T
LEDTFNAFLLAAPRAIVAITMLPLLAKEFVPGLIRTTVALGVAAFVAAAGGESLDTAARNAQLSLWFIVVKEMGLGFLMATSFSVLFYGIQAVGDYIDYYSGLTQSQGSDPFNGNQSSPLSLLFGRLAITFFIVSGGLVAYVVGVIESYSLWPPASFVPNISMKTLNWFAEYSSTLFSFGLLLLAPLCTILFLIDLTFAWVGRSAQQLDIQSISGPVKSVVATLLLAISLPAIFDRLLREAGPFSALINLINTVLR